jgi:hypothetical protein
MVDKIVGIDFISSPEPSDDTGKHESENPWVRYISSADIVSGKYEELYEYQFLE